MTQLWESLAYRKNNLRADKHAEDIRIFVEEGDTQLGKEHVISTKYGGNPLKNKLLFAIDHKWSYQSDLVIKEAFDTDGYSAYEQSLAFFILPRSYSPMQFKFYHTIKKENTISLKEMYLK
jgi:hypothetical protein